MDLGHLLTRSGLPYPEVSSKVCHNSFCQLGNSVSLSWVIYYEAFYLHVPFISGSQLVFSSWSHRLEGTILLAQPICTPEQAGFILPLTLAASQCTLTI